MPPTPQPVPADLLAEFDRLLAEHTTARATVAALALRYGRSAGTIRRWLAAARRGAGQAEPQVTPFTVLPKVKSDTEKDVARWQEAVRDLESRNYFTVVHLSDVHMPFQDEDALELAYQVIEKLKPDLIVGLSDGFDFAQISHFASDPDLPSDDILDNVREHWWRHNDRLSKVAPKAYRRAITGNHDIRLLAYLAEVAPQVRYTVKDAFNELVRYRGSVMFPDHLSEINVNCLTVMHGNKTTLGMYGAKRQLEARKYQRFIMSGHSHSPGFYFTRGPERAAASVVGGCLCHFPHYIKDTTFNPWTQGFAYATVDTRNRFAWLEHAVFERSDGLIKTALGGRVYAQEISEQLSEKAA